jgi:hypothetical protein
MGWYTCERCGNAENTGWTDYYIRLGLELPLLCAVCDPRQRCHWHHETRSVDAGKTAVEPPERT